MLYTPYWICLTWFLATTDGLFHFNLSIQCSLRRLSSAVKISLQEQAPYDRRKIGSGTF